jgi:hypothetical protein
VPPLPCPSARLDSPTMESNGQFDFCILLDGWTCNERLFRFHVMSRKSCRQQRLVEKGMFYVLAALC